jgi:general secretion pathway protein H
MSMSGRGQAEPAGNGEAGFTMVELLVVFAIIAIVAAASALRVGATQDDRRAAAASNLVASALRQARLTAIQTGATVALPLPSAQHGVTLTQPVRLQIGPDVKIMAKAGRENIQSQQQPQDAPILFLPDGRSSGGQVVVQVGDVVRTVRVNWLTGLVSEDAHAAR